MVVTFREENVPFKAASIAYYAMASFLPLLVLAFAVLSIVGAPELLVEFIRTNLSPTGVDIVDSILTDTSGRQIAGVLGLALTIWSGSKVFRGLTIAFEELYDAGSDRSLPERIAKSVLVLALLVGVLALLVASAILLGIGQFSAVASNLVAAGLLALLFFPFYYLLPPISTSFRHAVPGTVLAAVGLVVLQVVFFYYAQFGGGPSTYGVLGGMLLFITFLYFAANVLLTGVVLNVAADW